LPFFKGKGGVHGATSRKREKEEGTPVYAMRCRGSVCIQTGTKESYSGDSPKKKVVCEKKPNRAKASIEKREKEKEGLSSVA